MCLPWRQVVIPIGVAATMGAACSRPAPTSVALEPPRALESPAGPDSFAPRLTVSPDSRVTLSWLEPTDSEHMALRDAELVGGAWSEPRTVAEGDRFFANWADVPSVQRVRGRTLVAHWLEMSGPRSYDYDVRVRLSHDDGATWSPPLTPHADGTQSEHGFVSFFRSAEDAIGLVWLDGRAMAGAGPHHESGPHGGAHGAMTLRAGTIDVEGRVAETLVDDRVCECCPTAAVETAEGVVVAYRNRSADEFRDIYVTRLEDGTWSTPRAVADEGWMIAGCPVNGPALAANGREVAVAWFTGADDDPRVQVAFSSDAGRTFGPPVRVSDAGAIGRASVAWLPDGAALVGWIEVTEAAADFRVLRVDREGVQSEPVTVADISSGRDSGYPRLVRSGDRIVFAWTDSVDGSRHVRTASSLLR